MRPGQGCLVEGCARAGAARAESWGEDLPSMTVGEAMATPWAFDYPESAHFGIAFEMLGGARLAW